MAPVAVKRLYGARSTGILPARPQGGLKGKSAGTLPKANADQGLNRFLQGKRIDAVKGNIPQNGQNKKHRLGGSRRLNTLAQTVDKARGQVLSVRQKV